MEVTPETMTPLMSDLVVTYIAKVKVMRNTHLMEISIPEYVELWMLWLMATLIISNKTSIRSNQLGNSQLLMKII